MDSLPDEWRDYAQRVFEIASHIKTYDQEKYEVKVEKNSIKIILT
jgi:dihydrofolate reductase